LRRAGNRCQLQPSARVVFARFRVFIPGTWEAFMACFLPLRPFNRVGPRVFGSESAAHESTKAAILSCASTPPRRVYLTRAADLLTSYVDRKPRSTSASRKLFGPTAYPETGTHLFAALSSQRPESVAMLSGCRAPGFGYPLDASSSPHVLGGLFQPPTLMGFAFQSFVSSRMIGAAFPPSSPLVRFPTKPLGLVPALQRLAPTLEAVPLTATRRIKSGRGRMLS